jgi:PDZ domain
MVNQLKSLFAVLLALIGLALNAGTAHAKDPALLSLTMEHFRDTATVKDDPAGAMTTISTEKGFMEHRGPLRMVWNDEFLKGVIDKKTGQKSFQVSAWITYNGGWRSYETTEYQTANGPRSVRVTQIRKEAVNCPVGECTYTEHLEFPVGEEFLRRLAAERVPARPDIWRYRFVAKAGPDYSGGLSTAEIAGLLAKVDAYTGALPAVANAAGAALKLDLGIGGMPVAASAEQPNRAGILVTAVNGASVAHASGIIVGDIIYDFAGRPIRTLTDLQSAVATCAANSAVAIKLYRGTTDTAVTAQF